VAVREDRSIIGFATVSASEIGAALLPVSKRKKLPLYPLPVLRLARLAVDERAHGQGEGSMLLRAALLLAMRMRDDMGCVGLVVDAKPEAVAFYERLGFARLDLVAGQLGDRPMPLPMFLELGGVPTSPASSK
jgi:ribosomal protein S18 acetylase RimI-like enzyme